MAENTPVPPNAPAKPDPFIGMEIAGCKITQRLGAGGMGSAYKAHHPGLDKWVCIKVLAPDLANDERYVQFFLREARSVARLEHPNIVQVFNIGQERGIHYIVMSYIEGRSLSDIIKEKGKLDFDVAVHITKGILGGLAHAHSKEIIHRDIKPSNILIADNWDPKIIDFGLARQINEEKQLTMVGEMVGTAYLMPPEQGLGRKVDHRADLYSTGVTFFYMLAGRYPFEGKTSIEVVHMHISDPPPNIIQLAPDTPLWAAAIIERFLKKKPDDRFQTAQEAIEALEKGSGYKAPLKPLSKAIDLNATKDTLNVSSTPATSFATKEEMAQISKVVPGVISFDEIMAEQMQQAAAKPVDQKGKPAAKAPPPPPPPKPGQQAAPQAQFSAPPSKPSAPSMHKETEPLVLVEDEAPKSRISWRDWAHMLIYVACVLGVYFFSVTTGIVCAAKTTATSIDGWGYFRDPWLSGAFVPHQLPLAATTLGVLFVAALMGISSFFSPSTLLLCAMAVAGYLGGISWPSSILHDRLSLKILGLATSAGGHLVSDTSVLVGAGVAFLGGIYFLSRTSDRLSGRIFGAVCALAMPPMVWYYCSNCGQYAGADFIFVVASAVTAAIAIALGFMKKESLLPLVGPFLMLGASMLSMWYYSVSGLTDRFTAQAVEHQARVISDAEARNRALSDQYDKAVADIMQAAKAAEVKAKAPVQNEVPLITGDGVVEKKPVQQAPAQEIKLPPKPKLDEVPKARPQEDLRSEAKMMALREPFSRFQDKAGANSAYVLVALVLAVMSMVSFVASYLSAIKPKTNL